MVAVQGLEFKMINGFAWTDEPIGEEQRKSAWAPLLDELEENGGGRCVRVRDGETDDEFQHVYKALYVAAKNRNIRSVKYHFCVSKRGDKIFVECWEV